MADLFDIGALERAVSQFQVSSSGVSDSMGASNDLAAELSDGDMPNFDLDESHEESTADGAFNESGTALQNSLDGIEFNDPVVGGLSYKDGDRSEHAPIRNLELGTTDIDSEGADGAMQAYFADIFSADGKPDGPQREFTPREQRAGRRTNETSRGDAARKIGAHFEGKIDSGRKSAYGGFEYSGPGHAASLDATPQPQQQSLGTSGRSTTQTNEDASEFASKSGEFSGAITSALSRVADILNVHAIQISAISKRLDEVDA